VARPMPSQLCSFLIRWQECDAGEVDFMQAANLQRALRLVSLA
jgi:hypothetical protein